MRDTGCCCPIPHACLSAELESLLATQRAREYAGELGVQQGAGQLGAMHQRNRALEQQVGVGFRLVSSILLSARAISARHHVNSLWTPNLLAYELSMQADTIVYCHRSCLQVAQLQQQVSMLQQSRDIQDRELSRLKAEALGLAARTAAAASGSGAGSPAAAGLRPGSSRASSSGGDGAPLQAQLSRLQRELAAAQSDRQHLQTQLAHLAASSNSSGSGVSGH